MKIKKIILLILLVCILSACTNISMLSNEEIINNINSIKLKPNTYKRGYKYYMPKGLQIVSSGTNYAIIKSAYETYYVFFDFISFKENKNMDYSNKEKYASYTQIKSGEKSGYLTSEMQGNQQYLIEIMYNYAKIEVMVDEYRLKSAISNSISILSSVVYDRSVIEYMLSEDNLAYTEEIYDLFKDVKNKSNSLNYIEKIEDIEDDVIKDPDFIN